MDNSSRSNQVVNHAKFETTLVLNEYNLKSQCFDTPVECFHHGLSKADTRLLLYTQ